MYILPNEDMLGGSSELLNEEPYYVTKLTTAYGAGTCLLHVLSLVTEELRNMLHWQQEYAHWTFLGGCMKNHMVQYIDSSLLSGNVLNWCSSTVNRRAAKCDIVTAAYWAGTCTTADRRLAKQYRHHKCEPTRKHILNVKSCRRVAEIHNTRLKNVATNV
jgi:hypothetical protein